MMFALQLTAQTTVPVFGTYQEMEHSYKHENDTLYVINFWATWCKPCVAELPYFIENENQFKKEKIKFILVSLDFSDQLGKRVMPFLKEKKIETTCFLLADQDSNEWIPQVDEIWSGAIPATALFKNGKKVGFVERNFDSTTELKSFINKYL